MHVYNSKFYSIPNTLHRINTAIFLSCIAYTHTLTLNRKKYFFLSTQCWVKVSLYYALQSIRSLAFRIHWLLRGKVERPRHCCTARSVPDLCQRNSVFEVWMLSLGPRSGTSGAMLTIRWARLPTTIALSVRPARISFCWYLCLGFRTAPASYTLLWLDMTSFRRPSEPGCKPSRTFPSVLLFLHMIVDFFIVLDVQKKSINSLIHKKSFSEDTHHWAQRQICLRNANKIKQTIISKFQILVCNSTSYSAYLTTAQSQNCY